MSTKQSAPDVRVGQVWADNDWRSKGRRVRVDAIGPGPGINARFAYASCTVVAHPDARVIGKKTEIRVNRFKPTSTGYVLVQESDGIKEMADSLLYDWQCALDRFFDAVEKKREDAEWTVQQMQIALIHGYGHDVAEEYLERWEADEL